MRRGVTLVSVAITAFSLVILVSVVYGYRVSAEPEAPTASGALLAAERAPTAGLVSEASVRSPRVSAKQAAMVASEFLQRTDAYSVQLVEYNGVQAYKVLFTSGDVVYVSLEGQVLGSEPPAVLIASKDRKEREDEGTRRSSGGDDDDDHEEQDEPEHEGEGG